MHGGALDNQLVRGVFEVESHFPGDFAAGVAKRGPVIKDEIDGSKVGVRNGKIADEDTDIGDSKSLVGSEATGTVFECAARCRARNDCSAVTFDAAEQASCRMYCLLFLL